MGIVNKHRNPVYSLRINPELKARLQDEAASNNRSLHAEIVDRLEKSFESSEITADQWEEIFGMLDPEDRQTLHAFRNQLTQLQRIFFEYIQRALDKDEEIYQKALELRFDINEDDDNEQSVPIHSEQPDDQEQQS